MSHFTGTRLVVLCVLLASGPAAGQTPLPVPTPGAQLRHARAALAEKNYEDVLRLCEAVLEGDPTNREATALKIDALLALGDPEGALHTYNALVARTRTEDPAMLAKIARAGLRAEAAAGAAPFVVAAMEKLAAAGDDGAVESLETWADGDASRGQLAREALARLGHRSAVAALSDALAAGHPAQQMSALRALAVAGRDARTSAVIDALRHADIPVRMVAAETLGAIGDEAAVPALKESLQGPIPPLRLSAAIALVRLGDPSGRPLAERALQSRAAYNRLEAARALAGTSDDRWLAPTRELLEDPDGLTRLQAAELLLEHGRSIQAAREILKAAMADENPAIRAESARILAIDSTPDVPLLRSMLEDPEPRVRVEAAGRLARLFDEPGK